MAGFIIAISCACVLESVAGLLVRAMWGVVGMVWREVGQRHFLLASSIPASTQQIIKSKVLVI